MITARSAERWLLWTVLGGALVAVLVAGLLGPRWRRGVADVPPALSAVPAFELTDQNGNPVTLGTLAGKPWIATFVFTRCVLSCPRMVDKALELARELPAGTLRTVLVSVDPAHDTPPVMAAYLRQHRAPEDWRFLTGPEPAVRSLARDGFKLAVEPKQPGAPGYAEEPLLHSTRFVLVDGRGLIRGYYDAFDANDFARLEREARLVAEER